MIQLVRHSRMLVFKQEVEHRLRARFLNTTEAMVDEEREQCARGIVKASFLHYNLPLLPEGIWKCSNLVSLECYATKLRSLSPKIGRLGKLRSLEPFMYAPCGQRWLPYEIHHTSLVPSGEEMVLPAGLPPLPHFPTGPPTLQELAGRTILRRNLPTGDADHVLLPTTLRDYLRAAKQCSVCLGPYWDTVYATWSQGLTTEPFLALSCSPTCTLITFVRCVCGPQTSGSVLVVVEAEASVGQLDEEELEVDVDLDDLRAIAARTTAAEGSVDLRQLICIKRGVGPGNEVLEEGVELGKFRVYFRGAFVFLATLGECRSEEEEGEEEQGGEERSLHSLDCDVLWRAVLC